MTQMTTHATSSPAEAYVRFWNLPPDEQRAVGRTLFSDGVVQYAPIGELSGLDALIGFTQQFADATGDYAFRRRTTPEQHHDRIRVQWEILQGDLSFAEGTDVLILDREGHITSITTFLDRAPEGFDPNGHAGAPA